MVAENAKSCLKTFHIWMYSSVFHIVILNFFKLDRLEIAYFFRESFTEDCLETLADLHMSQERQLTF